MLAPVVRDLRWLAPRLLPCENDTVLNDPPLVYDLLLRWRIQGNCRCFRTDQSQFGVTALVALVELQAPVVAKELARVLATQALGSQLHRHRLPVHSVLIRCRVLGPAGCRSIVRLAAIV